MEENKSIPVEDKPDDSKFVAFLRRIYKKFNLFSEIKEEDSIFIMVLKIILRIIGIIFIIALSPFLILGLLIAFLAVS